MTQTFLTTYQPLELRNLIAECVSETVRVELSRLTSQSEPKKQILTRQETAELLNISLPTLHDYTKRGVIKAHRLGYKVRYRLEDVQNALQQINTRF